MSIELSVNDYSDQLTWTQTIPADPRHCT